MTRHPVDEATIDCSLDHYVEGRVLELALARAATDEERAQVRRLMTLRQALLQRRADHMAWMIARRHARNEVYTDAKVSAINAMGPTQSELEEAISGSYARCRDAPSVLKAFLAAEFSVKHAQSKSWLRQLPEDVRDAARQMSKDEAAFAAEWLAVIGDPAFPAELRAKEREWAVLFRDAARPMFLVSEPRWPQTDEIDAEVLGRAWNKLDAICKEHQVRPLSDFIGIDGQAREDSAAAAEVLVTVDALRAAAQDARHRIPAKRATREVLDQLRAALLWLDERQGHVHFEIDL